MWMTYKYAEEADTEIILHKAYLAQKGIKTTHVFSPDTNVLILALSGYPQFLKDFLFFFVCDIKRFIQLCSIGPLKVSAFSVLHALLGANVTGSFAGK